MKKSADKQSLEYTFEDLQAEADAETKRIADHDAKFGEGSWERIRKQFVEATTFESPQAEADAKASLAEIWQAIYEEGEEQGDRDAADGMGERYAAAVEALKFHPQQPYWQGYVVGYEDGLGLGST